ncbi:S-adenosyl-L-methionine-dependent methyltransferase [Xylaria cf. heliscus]|nr:S-adenosyl-L-methionine-dependent methyltransferase [Xylaria cf. heliscus]
MATSRISELANRIAENTAKLDSYLLRNNLPSPSFDIDGPRDTLIPKNEVDLESSRVAIIDDTLELRRLVLGPREYLMSYTHDELISQQAITRYRIAHSFPVGQEASFADIASATGLDQALVRRFVRHAIVKDIFSEPRPGIVAHNAVSRLLAEDQVIHDWVGASTDDLWQAAAQTCNALDKWSGSQEPNETGFSIANETDKSIYVEFSKYPERARRFGNAMRSFTEGTGFELDHVLNGFPWGGLQDGTIVDVGGSQGFASFAIARRFPSVTCVVQDLEPVVLAAAKEMPADIAGRVKFMTHDFFTEQPVFGADIYFFRWIFHNWSDKYCIEILKKHIPALKPGAKIVINDNVLPGPGVLSKWQEDRLRSMDLTMTELQNSHEREVDEWAKLFKDTDTRFEFQGATRPPGSNLWILVAEWKGSL